MKLNDLRSIFRTIGLPVVAGEWGADETPIWPFIEYHMGSSDDFMADGKNYFSKSNCDVSVYAKSTDMINYWQICEQLEDELEAAEVQYERTTDIFPGDGICYSTYTFKIER